MCQEVFLEAVRGGEQEGQVPDVLSLLGVVRGSGRALRQELAAGAHTQICRCWVSVEVSPHSYLTSCIIPGLPTAAPAAPSSISAAHPKGLVGTAADCPSSLQPPTFRGGTSLKGPHTQTLSSTLLAPHRLLLQSLTIKHQLSQSPAPSTTNVIGTELILSLRTQGRIN